MKLRLVIYIFGLTIVVCATARVYACCEEPVAYFTGPPFVYCGDEATFTCTSTDADSSISSRYWIASGGTPSTGTASTFTTKWCTAGIKLVTLTVWDSDCSVGCCPNKSDSYNRDFGVPPVAIDSVSSDKDAACAGCTITFTATTIPPDKYGCLEWSGGGTPATGSGQTFTTSWSTAGTKTVTASCCGSSKPKQVTIVEVASVASDKNEACDGENVTFTVTTNPPGFGSLVSWSGGGTPATGSGATFTTKWSTGGTKTVTATCGTSSKYKQVTILAACDCTIVGSWHNMSVGSESDECDNTLTLTFNNNVYCYYYNRLKVGNCPYLGGENIIGYWKTINEKRFYATYHKSMDDKNDGSQGDEGTQYKYDSVIWRYDCISNPGSPSKTAIEHPTIKGGDDGTGGAFEEAYCPPI